MSAEDIASDEEAAQPTRHLAKLVLGCAAFCGVGLALERSEWFAPIRAVMRDPTLPAHMVEEGTLGDAFLGLDLVTGTGPRVDWRWRSKPRPVVYTPYEGAATPPDSAALGEPFTIDGLDLISIGVDPIDLDGPVTGIHTHWDHAVERRADVTWFRGDEAVFQALCGIRLHGGYSRFPETRAVQGGSYRLHFRERYGTPAFAPDQLFGPDEVPIDRVVVRGASPINTALGFDVVRACGAPAPAMRPVLFVLNGEIQRVYSVSEHLTKRNWERKLGHDDLFFHRVRGDNAPRDVKAVAELRAWADALPVGATTRAMVAERVDVDNLSRHLFAILYCGADDWAQGALVLDRTEDDPRWHWIAWDMDRSFEKAWRDMPGPAHEKHAIDLILGRRPFEEMSRGTALPEMVVHERAAQQASLRAQLFGRLIDDDPAYRAEFARLAVDLLNHALTPEFLEARIADYARYAVPGLWSPDEIQRVRDFVALRGGFVLRDIARELGLPPIVRLRITAPAEAGLRVDGFAVGAGYVGRYFPGHEVVVEAASGAGFDWRLDGAPVPGGPLTLDLERDHELVLSPR